MNQFLSLQRALLFFLLIGSLAMSAVAAPTPDVKAANSALKRAEASLQLVNGSIGHLTAPPKGSAGKLNRMRLDMAGKDVNAAGKLVAQLKGGQGAAQSKARYAAATALYKKLDDILSGRASTPKPAPGPAPKGQPKSKTPKPGPAAPATVKLGYPHADVFKNTLFTLRRVEKDTRALTGVMAKAQPVKDQLSISHRTTFAALELARETQRQAGFVQDGFQKIPANGEGVAEAKKRLGDARASLASCVAYFQPLNERLVRLIDPAAYPSLHADLERIRDLGTAYGDPATVFVQNRAAAAEAFQQRDASLEESNRIETAYARLIQQDTAEGRAVKNSCANLRQRRGAFLAAAAEVRAALPADIRKAIAEVQGLASDAVAQQKPMWFTGGIPQQVGFIDEKLMLLTALDPENSADTRAEVQALKDGLAVQADSLKALIIRENPLPADGYQGTDRSDIVAIATAAWKQQDPDLELLAVRIPADTWKRQTKWTYSNGTWYFYDSSFIQVHLIVADKDNPEQAIDQPINLHKDHQDAEKLSGSPLRTFGDPLQPSSYLLRSKVK